MGDRRDACDLQTLVRPGALRQFEQWLGTPGWFREGTSLAAMAGPLPELVTLDDERIMLENVVLKGGAVVLLRRLAQAPQLPLSGLMTAAMAVAPTLGDALDFMLVCLERATPHMVAATDKQTDGRLALRLTSRFTAGAGAFAACCAGVVLLRLVESFSFERIGEVELHLPEACAALMGPLADELPCAIQAGGAKLALLLPADMAHTANPGADAVLWRLFRDQARAWLRWGGDTPVATLKSLLARSLREEQVVLRRQEAAQRLGISERTLSRLLALVGTSFVELQAGERRALAGELMMDPALSLQAIADRLGFPDQSTFGRAFRGWHGESPGRFRQRLFAAG